jgi:hypothetical protein
MTNNKGINSEHWKNDIQRLYNEFYNECNQSFVTKTKNHISSNLKNILQD